MEPSCEIQDLGNYDKDEAGLSRGRLVDDTKS